MNRFVAVFEYAKFIDFRSRFHSAYAELKFANANEIVFVIIKYADMIESDLLPHVQNAKLKSEGVKLMERLKNAPVTYNHLKEEKRASIRVHEGSWIYEPAKKKSVDERKDFIEGILDEIVDYTGRVMLDYSNTRGLV